MGDGAALAGGVVGTSDGACLAACPRRWLIAPTERLREVVDDFAIHAPMIALGRLGDAPAHSVRHSDDELVRLPRGRGLSHRLLLYGHWPIVAISHIGVNMHMAIGRDLFLASCQYAFGMTDDFPSRSLDKVIVRLPDGMRDRLKAEAEANKRSMNAEIVARLEASFLSISPAFVDKPELAQKFEDVMGAMLEFVRDAHNTDAKLVIKVERPEHADGAPSSSESSN